VKIDLMTATFLQHLPTDFSPRVWSAGMIEAISVWDFGESLGVNSRLGTAWDSRE
jgi:hypothetical protein